MLSNTQSLPDTFYAFWPVPRKISKNWRGKPLVDFDTVVKFACNTTTTPGLRIDACRDERSYEKGKRVSDKEMDELAVSRGDVLGKWNYTISPRPANFHANVDPTVLMPSLPTSQQRALEHPVQTVKM